MVITCSRFSFDGVIENGRWSFSPNLGHMGYKILLSRSETELGTAVLQSLSVRLSALEVVNQPFYFQSHESSPFCVQLATSSRALISFEHEITIYPQAEGWKMAAAEVQALGPGTPSDCGRYKKPRSCLDRHKRSIRKRQDL